MEINDLETKLEHLKKLVKKVAILIINSDFHHSEFLEKINCCTKVVFLVRKYSKKFFFEELSFLKF
jgi:hypothetical protein